MTPKSLMVENSMKIFTAMGTDVKLHWSLFIPFAICVSDPSKLMFLVIIFTIVVLHEFGHIIAAKRYNNFCHGVTLSAIGGVAILDRPAETPKEELVVAVAGPLVNIVLISLGLLVFPIMPREFIIQFLIANFFLVGFNAIPAYPMDGGRALRAMIWMCSSKVTSVKICAVITVVFGIAGLCASVYFSRPMLAVISIVIVIMALGETKHLTEAEEYGTV